MRASISPRVFAGSSVEKLVLDRDMPWLDPQSQQARDVERFRWFSNGYIARDPVYSNRVIDIRYSMLPNQIEPLWSIELKPGAAPRDHVRYRTHRESSRERVSVMWEMITGR